MSVRRVTAKLPCPVCGRPSWCGRLVDGSVICMRTPSNKPTRNGGYLHTNGNGNGAVVISSDRVEFPRAVNWPAVLGMFARALSPQRMADLSVSLGVAVASLGRLGVGYDTGSGMYTFPMQSRPGTTCGVRLRGLSGEKKAVSGSRNGVFAPYGMTGNGPLLVCEGPTDVAAMLDLGFDVVGRASCLSGHAELPAWCGPPLWHAPRTVVVVADRDPAQSAAEFNSDRGTQWLVEALRSVAASVVVIRPPDGVKDARKWKQSGATRSDIERAIHGAQA